ncbi:MAG: PD40 domain-containing protein [Syntrophaceae bacterium]|nr:PD40 domain-containing protein [Syntrophaceae bacterium]
MNNKQFKLSVSLLIGFGLIGIQAQNAPEFPVLKGDYLGQPPPGETPVIFARGVVSTDDKEHWAPRFSPDGNDVFWWSIRQEKNDKWLNFHRTMRRSGGRWMAPEVSPFAGAPIFSPDGKRLYLGSPKEGEDLTFVERQGKSWSEPKPVGLVSRFPKVRFAYFPSIAANGNLYFMGYLAEQFANIGIYRAEFVNGVYAKPELLPPCINTKGGERNWTPFIAPDESYLLFSSTRGLPDSDQGDLFISFRQPDDGWTDPVGLGEPINSKELERFPAITPDGKYLFFTRNTNLPGYIYDEDVYWVSAAIIGKLKAEAIQEQRLKQRNKRRNI